MTPRTRRVYDAWPDYWMEWGESAFQVERRLEMTRREVANRAAWLVKRGYIRRCWVEIWRAPGEPERRWHALAVAIRIAPHRRIAGDGRTRQNCSR